MHDIRYNEARDEFYVNNPFAQAVLTFRGAADGQEAPIRVIQGPKTKLISADTLEIDTTNNEIVVPQGDEVLVFPMMANGDVVTDGTVEIEGEGWRTSYRGGRDSILIFDRTANGEVKPLRVIRGPKTGIQGIRQMQVLPKGGWIVITQITDGGIAEPEGTFVGVWSINDNGDVPPRWKIDGKGNNVMKKPRGVALDPKHKEVIVSDMRLNAVLTFYFPEIF